MKLEERLNKVLGPNQINEEIESDDIDDYSTFSDLRNAFRRAVKRSTSDHLSDEQNVRQANEQEFTFEGYRWALRANFEAGKSRVQIGVLIRLEGARVDAEFEIEQEFNDNETVTDIGETMSVKIIDRIRQWQDDSPS